VRAQLDQVLLQGPRQLLQLPGGVCPQVLPGLAPVVVPAVGVRPVSSHQHLDEQLVSLQGGQVQGGEPAAGRGDVYVDGIALLLGVGDDLDEALMVAVLGKPVESSEARHKVFPGQQAGVQVQQPDDVVRIALGHCQQPLVLQGIQSKGQHLGALLRLLLLVRPCMETAAVGCLLSGGKPCGAAGGPALQEDFLQLLPPGAAGADGEPACSPTPAPWALAAPAGTPAGVHLLQRMETLPAPRSGRPEMGGAGQAPRLGLGGFQEGERPGNASYPLLPRALLPPGHGVPPPGWPAARYPAARSPAEPAGSSRSPALTPHFLPRH